MLSIFRTCAAVLCIFLASCTTKSDKSITVLSYNIHHGVGMDTILNLERIARVINSVSPDVVALQEVDINTVRNGKVHQMEVLAKLTNMNFAFSKSIDLQGGEYGNGILTKFPIKKQITYLLPGEEPRSALAVTMELENEKEIVLISTHLATEKKGRIASIEPVQKMLKDFNELPIIIAGDFNAIPESKILSKLSDNLINTTVDKKTYPVDIPTEQIDYIFCSSKNQWSVESSRVLDEKIASDHRPLMSILKLK